MSDLRQNTSSLAGRAVELELICQEIDAADGEISDALIARFDDAKLALSAKVDGWILYLDAIKYMAEALKERKERAAKAQKTAEALQARLKDYLKHVLVANPGIPFKGEEGSIYLHKNPQGVRYAFQFEDKTFYRTVDRALLDMEPSMNSYVKQATVYMLDGEKVKQDLKAGMTLPWAELHQDSHLRTKG